MGSHDKRGVRTDVSWKRWANLGLCLIIFLLIGYGINRVAEAPDLVSLLDPGIVPNPRVEQLGQQLELADYRFDLHQVGNRVRAEFTLVNGGSHPLRDIGISCEFYDHTGEKRGRGHWVIYDTVEPGSTKRYELVDQRYISHLAAPEAGVCHIVDVLSASGRLIAEHQAGTGH